MVYVFSVLFQIVSNAWTHQIAKYVMKLMTIFYTKVSVINVPSKIVLAVLLNKYVNYVINKITFFY